MINATRTIVSINGKQKNLGYYKSQEDALKALRLVELKNSYKENSYKENKIKKNNIKNTSINRDPDTKPKNTRINSPSNIIHLFLVLLTLGLWFPVCFFVLLYQREKRYSDYKSIMSNIITVIYTITVTSIVTFFVMLIAYLIL